MSSTSDNPLARFSAFFWAVGVFSLFGVIVLALKLFSSDTSEHNPLEEEAAKARYEFRKTTDEAQAAGFAYKEVEKGKTVQVPPHDIFAHLGESLVSQKPAPVKDDAQIVPGSDTQEDRNNQKGPDMSLVDAKTPAADTPIDPAVMAKGQATYAMCMACHGAAGEGGPVGPPLAESEWVTGPVSNLIRIQLRGLQGPMHIKGQLYTPLAPMTPIIATQDDETIASVLTYIRNSFGNKAAPVLPEQVEMLRSEVGKSMLTEADLIKP
ncbi:cytochrome c [Luteolibacter flavescens]|uniref:Cytochrome c n=1 Tax=Luteolibacter flavescens TaxID=1859460 RepID=A0ABT3FQA2_9BACT|nr:cytochrome c [Luteolibacter flavescens]MCW1885411.1 cytochrome c [Luteolibacter flavescens]